MHDLVIASGAAAGPNYHEPTSGRPGLRLAIVTCMDARLDDYRTFGIRPGDAHVLRNAGGLVTDDVLRSLAISQRALGTTDIAIVHHTKCGMQGFDDGAFRAELAQTGEPPPWDVPGFTDVDEDVRADVRTVKECPWLLHRDQVAGFVFEVETGRVRRLAT